MSRYIDADALMTRMLNYYSDSWRLCEEINDFFLNTPTADVVEVVRCKDCKWYAGDGMYCANDIIVQFDHFYCYNGERREDG